MSGIRLFAGARSARSGSPAPESGTSCPGEEPECAAARSKPFPRSPGPATLGCMSLLTMLLAALALLAQTQPAMPDALAPDDPAAFRQVVSDDASVRKLAGGFKFLEGPAWTGDRLLFSDIPNSTIHAYENGAAGVYRNPSNKANGNAHRDGTLYTCEHESRLVSATDDGGERRVLVDGFEHEGKPVKFNSPNDVAVAPGGAVYFTDPPWGLPGNRRDELMEYGGSWVFRHDPATGQTTPVAKEMSRPNGLCFSPDGRTLYVGDDKEKIIRKFAVEGDGSLTGGEVFAEIDAGVPDGIRCDADGRLYSSAGDGVHVFSPGGTRIGKILVPEGPANLTFGGPDGRTLFITAKTGLYAIDLNVSGAD